MPWIPGFNTPLNMAVNGAGHTETEEEMKERIAKEVKDRARKMKIKMIVHWIQCRTIYLPRKIYIRLWALMRHRKNRSVSIEEIESTYYLHKQWKKTKKELRKELNKSMKEENDEQS